MLSNDQQEQLIELLVATAEVIGDEVRPMAAALMAEDLAVYPIELLQAALAQCRRELKGRLSLASILERIDDGHPSPNEAWAMAIPAADERNTVVWTGQMQAAWAVALPLIAAGDKIAARQAFLEVYTRELKDARAERAAAIYSPSLGFDASSRDAALRQAVERGRLTLSQVREHVRIEAPAPAFDAVALIAGRVEVTAAAPAPVRKRLQELRAALDLPEAPERAA